MAVGAREPQVWCPPPYDVSSAIALQDIFPARRRQYQQQPCPRACAASRRGPPFSERRPEPPELPRVASASAHYVQHAHTPRTFHGDPARSKARAMSRNPASSPRRRGEGLQQWRQQQSRTVRWMVEAQHSRATLTQPPQPTPRTSVRSRSMTDESRAACSGTMNIREVRRNVATPPRTTPY